MKVVLKIVIGYKASLEDLYMPRNCPHQFYGEGTVYDPACFSELSYGVFSLW